MSGCVYCAELADEAEGALTVGELRRALAQLPDDLPVLVETTARSAVNVREAHVEEHHGRRWLSIGEAGTG